jgi:CBS domain-containing protein
MSMTIATVGALPAITFAAHVVAAEVASGADLGAIAAGLVEADVGALAVGDGAGEGISGVVSERDLVRALAERGDPATTTARDLAHTRLVWCDAQSTVAEVDEEMMAHYVRHVLVEDRGEVVGIVSNRDLLGA